MAIIPASTGERQNADESVAFDVTVAVAATAEDLVTVPAGKRGRTLSIVNEGPGDAFVKFDGTAAATDVLLKKGDSMAQDNLELDTNVSVFAPGPSLPRLRGMLGAGPA